VTDADEEYTTAGLETLLGAIPDRLRGAGVAVSPVHFTGLRQPDMLFHHPEAPLADVLELIGISRPRAVFLAPNLFDSEQVVERPEGELPDLDALLRKASQRDGEVVGLTMTWVLDGMICTWLASARWCEQLIDEAEIIVEAAQGIDDIDRGLRWKQNREQLARCKAMILADAGFRRATVNKRTTVAKTLLAAQGEVIEDPWLERHLLKEVRQAAAIEVSQHEQNLDSQIPDIAERLIASDLWVNVRTQGQQMTAVAQFIIEVADGWMLSELFRKQVRVATLAAADRRRR
jgi:hypothetical protein